MNALAHEFKHALRGAAAQPGFSALVVGVLAMGLACVTFMLILIGSLVMRPLPFPDAGRLLHIGLDSGNSRIGRLDPLRSSDLPDLRRRLDGLATIGGFQDATINLSDMDRPERFDGAFVTGNLFSVLGVAPSLGRDFNLTDEQEGAAPVLMLSNTLWKSRYAADPGVVGRQVRVNARLATIVGVMPEDFSYPRREVVWMPGTFRESTPSDESYELVARRGSAVPDIAVDSALQSWFSDARTSEPDVFARSGIKSEPLAYLAVHAGTRNVLSVMLIATFLVLLIACANAANLLLTRTLARRHELSIRVALGADRRRLTIHLIAQSLLLSLIAAGIALLLARGAARWIDRLFRSATDGPPLWIHFDVDARIVGMTLFVAVLTAAVAGVFPALRAGGSAMAGQLRDSARNTTGGSGRISRTLMVAEVALSLTLLIAVGTLVRGVMALDRPNLGVDPSGILTARLGLFETSYPSGAEQVALFDRITQKLRDDPAVLDATAGTNLPGLDGWTREFAEEGADLEHDGALPRVNFAAVDDRYLSAYGIRLVQGRFFDSRDTAASTQVAVIDERFSEQYGKNGTVLGRRFKLDPTAKESALITVVGVVSRLTLDSPIDPPRPSLLVPLRQQPARFASLAIRVKGDPAAYAPELTKMVRDIDPDTPTYWVRTYAQVIAEATFDTRLLAKMFGVFGLLALLMAAAGLYGVIAFNVGQRTREIGVRRALGAPSSSVLRDVLSRAIWQVGIGIGVGLALGLALTQSLGQALNGVVGDSLGGDNAASIAAALAVLLLATVVAVLLPARRALRVDPMVALRHE